MHPAKHRRPLSPLIRFLALGSLLFVADRWRAAPRHAESEAAPIVVSADDVARARDAWQAQYGLQRAPADERVLVQDLVDEEILNRQARALRLDRGDRIVRARLVALGRFLALGAADDDDALERAARDLGLARRDPIIRRHLAHMAALVLTKQDGLDLPDEGELERYYEAHADALTQPARIAFTHVYLSAQRRGPGLDADAARLAAALAEAGVGPTRAPSLGDPFLHGAAVPPATRSEIEQRFGAAFASAIEKAPAGAWSGPLRSSYGLHLVWVHERSPAQRPILDAVRSRIAHALVRERNARRLHDRLGALRARHRVVVSP